MQFLKKNIVSLLVLSTLCLSTGVFALESVDCINYDSVPDVRCKYYRIEDVRGAQLYVVPPNMVLKKANAIKGASFYVFAPDEKSMSRDILTLKQIPDDGDEKDIVNMTKVKANQDSGLVNLAVSSRHELFNFRLGTSEDAEASDPIISLVYNFYVPEVKYYDDKGNEITKKTTTSLKVLDTMKVHVEAVIPVGPRKGRVDSTLNKSFYIEPLGESASIEYLSNGGQSLKQSDADGRIKLDVVNGKASFMMVANKAVTDGKTFTLNAYEDGEEGDGVRSYLITAPYPGNYEFTNPDMPSLDKAVIYDADGDGIGDSIVTWFGGLMDSVDVKSFYYSWPNDKSFETYSGDVKRNKNQYSLPDVIEVEKDSATGAVKAYVCNRVSEKCDTLRAALIDSIGAVIQFATLLKGFGGDKDTLVISFNKDMDETWDSGRGFIVNGTPVDVSAISKKGNVWAFVVDKDVVHAGEMIKIETNCGKKECSEKDVLTAADGVPTDKNNQMKPIKDGGRIIATKDNSGFYDRDGDGRMDSASVGFETPITPEKLKSLEHITLYWLDSEGELKSITPSLSDWTISENGLVLGLAIDDPDKYDIKEMLTGIDPIYSKDGKTEYGYVEIQNKLSVGGKETTDSLPRIPMNDYMPPVIASTFLNPESFQMMEPDKFRITFSEAIDYENVDLSDILAFYVDGSKVPCDMSSVEWSDDGRTVTLFMEAGNELSDRVNPADSVCLKSYIRGKSDAETVTVSDDALADMPKVMVEGDPRVIMKTTSFADLNKAAELSDHVKPFAIVPGKSVKDPSDQSTLGVLMDVGFSTIMKKDSLGKMTPDMDDIGLSWELYVYTNLGGYVGGASGRISCDDKFFDGNCLENPDKLYVRWNMRADNGRRVGVGIYLAKFKVKVYGAKEDFKIERIFRWGISAKKH